MIIQFNTYTKVALLSGVLMVTACNNTTSTTQETEPNENQTQSSATPVKLEQIAELEQNITEVKSRINEQEMQTFELAAAIQEEALIIDLRSRADWGAGHVPGAINMSADPRYLKDAISTLAEDTQRPIYLYCGNGNRSAVIADLLQEMGYTNVTSLDGGYRVWAVSGNFIETSPPSIVN